jgi:predicted glycosyltransferase
MVDGAPSSFELTVTTRNYSELNRFLGRIGLESVSLGRHGGGDLLEKLKASVAREKELISFAEESSFDYSFSFISPEAARVSFGLGMSHFISSDSPHASAPSRLAVPLSSLLFTPYPIPRERWTQYGLKKSQVSRYHALDPWAWLMNSKFKATPKINGKIIIRLEEWFASYFRQGKGISSVLPKLLDGIHKLGNFEITLVPRYEEQRDWARKMFGNMAIVPLDAIDGAEEVSKTDLLIGGGATMTQEAALLGVPNISYFPSAELDVFSEYYFPKKLSVEAHNPSTLLANTFEVLRNLEAKKKDFIERAHRETSTFEDPIKYVFDHLPRSI